MVGRVGLAFVVVITSLTVSCGASSCLPAHKVQGEPDGRRPPTTRAAFEQLERLEPEEGGRSAVHSQVVLLSDNTTAWAARWRLLDGAKDSVDVTSFIVDDDVFGMAFLGHLYRRAIDGVRVRVLVDGRGSNAFLTPGFGAKDHLQELVHTGMVDVRIYNPPVKQIARALVELRTPSASALAGTHNKILVVDHARAITGGRNIARHYYADESEEKHGFFDADVLVSGGAVEGIAAAMEEDLAIHNREDIERDVVNIRSRREDLLMVYGAMDAWLKGSVPIEPREEAVLALEAAALAQLEGKLPARSVRDAVRPYFEELAGFRSLHGALERPLGTVHESQVRVISTASLMQDAEDSPGEALVLAIRGAKKTIAIESPYFVLTPQTLEALEEAARRGVAIDVVTNSAMSTDNPMSASLLLDTWPELMARVPTMRMFVKDDRPTLHAKRAVFDDALTLIGSYNLDPLSAYVMSETIVAVWSRSFNAQTRNEMEQLLGKGHMLEYKIARDDDGQARRYPRGHELAGHVIVEYGPRNHVPPEQVSSLVAQKDVVMGLKDLWEIPLVVY
jgi:cardiolipin synthase C